MNKRESCKTNETIAFYYGLGGVEIKGIEYGIDDYVYCISGTMCKESLHSYHKCKIYYPGNATPYFRISGYKIPLDECIRNGF